MTSAFCSQNIIQKSTMPDTILPFEHYDAEEINLIPSVKKISHEVLIERFNYASDHLSKLISDTPKISEIIDLDLLNANIQIRKDVLQKNIPELLNATFSEVYLIPESVNFNRSVVQNFIVWNSSLREALWYVPQNFNAKTPALNFVSDQTLIPRNGLLDGKLKEELLALTMAQIEMDLRSSPYLRGDDVPRNTRLLFDYFVKCMNENNDLEKKVSAYQKYLTKSENQNLTLQLLSVYLQNPKIYACENYMKYLTMQLFFYMDYKELGAFTSPNYYELIEMFQRYLCNKLALKTEYTELINNFVCLVLHTTVLDNKKNCKILLCELCSKKFEEYLQTINLKKH